MQYFFSRYPKATERLFEMLIPTTTWLIITLPIWLSPFHPAVVAYFILAFDVYFFYKSLTTTIFSTISYFKLKKLSQIDWLSRTKKLNNFSKVHQAIIITNYKETIDKVRITIQRLADQDFPLKRMFIFLAMEEREGQEAKERAKQLISEFRKTFGYITATFHPDLPGEIKGKASNSTWAAQLISRETRKQKIDPNSVIIASCDADSLHPQK